MFRRLNVILREFLIMYAKLQINNMKTFIPVVITKNKYS
jgi:hypothetical protein